MSICYSSVQEVSEPSIMPPAPPSEKPQGAGWCTSASGRTPASTLCPLATQQPPKGLPVAAEPFAKRP